MGSKSYDCLPTIRLSSQVLSALVEILSELLLYRFTSIQRSWLGNALIAEAGMGLEMGPVHVAGKSEADFVRALNLSRTLKNAGDFEVSETSPSTQKVML